MSETAAKPLRVGKGMSGSRDASEAGKAAATAALEPLGGEQPALILVFATPRYDLPALLAGVRSVTGSTLLVGGRPVIDRAVFSAVVAVVMITTLITPPLLVWALGRKR